MRQEYQNQLQIISQLKKQLNDLELKETEEINQLELERSLLNAEFDSESQKISKVKLKIALLKHKETRLSGFYEELQKEFRAKMIQAESRIGKKHALKKYDQFVRNTSCFCTVRFSQEHIFCNLNNGKKSIFTPEKSLKLPKIPFFSVRKL